MAIKLDFLEDAIELALFSAYLKDEPQTVSLLICAQAESKKSETVEGLQKLNSVLYVSDATAFEILTDYGDDIAARKIRHIVIPDLIPPFSKKWETSSSFVAFLNELTAEGIVESRTFALPKRFDSPVRAGLIACITPAELEDRRHKWVGAGFMSRMVPISWSYGSDTVSEIFDYICLREYVNEKMVLPRLPKQDKEVKIDAGFAKELLNDTYQYLNFWTTMVKADSGKVSEGDKLYGFRYQKNLQLLAMSSALRGGRDTVNEDDIKRIHKLSRYLNLNYTAV